jgi:hypothetical protein
MDRAAFKGESNSERFNREDRGSAEITAVCGGEVPLTERNHRAVTKGHPAPVLAYRSAGPRRSTYTSGVKQIWTGRIGQVAGKYGEHAPVVTTCCNACRTCVTTNALTLVMGAGAAVGVWATRFVRRTSAKPS